MQAVSRGGLQGRDARRRAGGAHSSTLGGRCTLAHRCGMDCLLSSSRLAMTFRICGRGGWVGGRAHVHAGGWVGAERMQGGRAGDAQRTPCSTRVAAGRQRQGAGRQRQRRDAEQEQTASMHVYLAVGYVGVCCPRRRRRRCCCRRCRCCGRGGLCRCGRLLLLLLGRCCRGRGLGCSRGLDCRRRLHARRNRRQHIPFGDHATRAGGGDSLCQQPAFRQQRAHRGADAAVARRCLRRRRRLSLRCRRRSRGLCRRRSAACASGCIVLERRHLLLLIY